jgi:uncharacterized protein
LSPLVLSAVVRAGLNARVLRRPCTHENIFKRLCTETDTRGPNITDAWFSALAIESGCEWVTFDRDDARFPGLKWHMPRAR